MGLLLIRQAGADRRRVMTADYRRVTTADRRRVMTADCRRAMTAESRGHPQATNPLTVAEDESLFF